MAELESKIVEKIQAKVLKPLAPNGIFFKIHGGPFQVAGIPDLIGCYLGTFVFIEVKRPGEKPTKLQTITMERLTRAGAVGGVATSIEEAQSIIEQVRLRLIFARELREQALLEAE